MIWGTLLAFALVLVVWLLETWLLWETSLGVRLFALVLVTWLAFALAMVTWLAFALAMVTQLVARLFTLVLITLKPFSEQD